MVSIMLVGEPRPIITIQNKMNKDELMSLELI